MRTRRFAAMPLAVMLGLLAAVALIGSGSANGGRPLTATLLGSSEVPVSGDPDGSGTARITVNPGQEEICYELAVEGIAPARAAHIHEAPAGVAGPVEVTLMAPTSGTSSGCASVDREVAKEILKHPEQYYVNVHNAEFPGGALRGQLSK